jgi:putative adenylate-forming enzyme
MKTHTIGAAGGLGDRARRLRDFGRALRLSRTELARADRMDTECVRRLQQGRLESLVRHAVANSPFYRDHYRGIDIGNVALAALPPVAKPALMNAFDGWTTDRRLKLAGLERHIDALAGDDLYLGCYRVMATSGSTGERGVFVYSGSEWTLNLANFARLNEKFVGVHPRLFPHRLRVASVGATSPLHISTRNGLSASVGINRVLRLDARRPLSELAAALDAFGPELVVGYPSVLAMLAGEQEAGRLRLHPAKVVTVSEVRTPEMTEAIRRAWGVEPFSWYGITEGGVLAGDCEHHRGMHVFEDFFIVENVDADGRAVPDGVVGHKLLLTNLFNRTQPLIRYEQSDMVVLDSRPCPCGRTLRRVASIEGRSDDILQLPARAGGQVAVHPITLRSPFARMPDVRQYKVLHDDDGLHLLLVARDLARPGEVASRARDALAKALVDAGAEPPPILVETVEAIPRDEGHGAKFKLVESRRTMSLAPGSGRRP